MFPGNAGYSAQAAINTPAYTTPGFDEEMHMINPTAMMHKHTKMNGERFPYRSLAYATAIARTAAVM